jgi:hypothetical protein
MTHPFHSHREHHKSRGRVGHIMKSGGHPHSDAAADKKLFSHLIAQHEAKEEGIPGHKHGGRLDKYARGGRTKGKHHTQVNIAVVAPHGKDASPSGAGALPGGPPLPRSPAAGPPPGLPPGGPPMAGPPGLPPGGGMPPGMKPPGMMKRGGKVKTYARGGKLGMTAGAESGEGRLQKARKYGPK